eukprot:UN22620
MMIKIAQSSGVFGNKKLENSFQKRNPLLGNHLLQVYRNCKGIEFLYFGVRGFVRWRILQKF